MTDPGEGYRTLVMTPDFLEALVNGGFGVADQRRILRALRLLDADEQHPSLRVHKLEGKLSGRWSASASDELRITFQRLEGGRKRLIDCSRHYRR
jgi:hypothetical protein